MKRATALGILTTMFLGLAAWAGSAIVKNKVEIRGLQVKEATLYDNIKEIKQDVKLLLGRER